MEIKILSHEEVAFQERDVQRAFEKDLSKLEEGLVFVASEVTIGTGRIDTLAFDTETNQPVFIEFKKRGEFNKDALVQLMDYLSWFVRDENRMALLTRWLKQSRNVPEAEVEPRIRVICVVTDIDERVRNAVYVIANPVKVFSYVVSRDTSGNVVLVPKLEVDNGEIEAQVPELASESELMRRHVHLLPAFERVRGALRNNGASEYPTRDGFAYREKRVFARLRFRKKYVFLDLKVGRNAVKDPDFTYWNDGDSSRGYLHLYPGADMQPKVLEWIALAKQYQTVKTDDDEPEDGDPQE